MLRQLLHVLNSCVMVWLHIRLWQRAAHPKVQFALTLNNSHASWVKTDLAGTALLIQVSWIQLANDAQWVILCMAHHKEDSRLHRDRVEIGIVQSTLPPDQLLNERHVWIGACTSVFHSLVGLFVRDTISVDHERADDRG